MKTAWLLVSLGLFLAMQSAEARIGETRAKMADRYGAGKDVGEQVLYTADRYSITVFFNAEGKVAMEIYGPRPTVDGKPTTFTDADINEFLHQEGQGKQWEQLALPTPQTVTWRRADAKAFARYIPLQQAFVVIGMDDLKSAPMPGVNQVLPGQPMPTTPAP